MSSEAPKSAVAWSHKDHKVVGISTKSRPLSRMSTRSRKEDDFSLMSASTKQSYKWDRRLQKPVEVDYDVVRWDPHAKKPMKKNMFRRAGGDQIENNQSSSGGSPKSSTAMFEDLSSVANMSKPTEIKVTRPKSADTAARRKKMKELEVKTMLIRLHSNSIKAIDGNRPDTPSPANSQDTDINKILEKKNKLLEEQQTLIRNLNKELQALSPKAKTNIPGEIFASEDRPNSPMSNLGSIFSASMFPFCDPTSVLKQTNENE